MSTVGTRISYSNLHRRVLRPARKAAGLLWVSRSTGLRHTCASALYEAGKTDLQVARWLGHSDPSFTIATYIHLRGGDEGLGSAEFLDDLVEAGGNSGATEGPQIAAEPPAVAAAS